MAYVNKLVDTQDTVMHDFNGEDHDDGGNRSHKRSSEAYMTDPPRPSTFLEGDFNMVMDDQCQFHRVSYTMRECEHTMRECEQLKRALGVPSDSKKTKSNNNDDRNSGQSTTGTVDLIDMITVIVGPILATMTGIDMIIAATIAAMTGVTTTIAMTITTGVTTTGVIAATTSVTTDEKIDVMIGVVKMTTTATTTTRKSRLHRHRAKGAIPMVHSSRPTERSTSLSAVAKRPKATNRPDQTQGRSSTSTPNLCNLCDGLNSQSLSPGKIIGSTFPTPRHTRWSLTP
jgi:hypothetical protein